MFDRSYHLQQLSQILRQLECHLVTTKPKDVTHIGIPRVYLTRMTEAGVLKRVQPGIYVLPGTILDEFAEIIIGVPKLFTLMERHYFYMIFRIAPR